MVCSAEAPSGVLPMIKLSFNEKRLILGVWLALCLLSVVNYYAGWALAGLREQAVLCTFLIATLLLHFMGPSLSEIQKSGDQQDSHERS